MQGVDSTPRMIGAAILAVWAVAGGPARAHPLPVVSGWMSRAPVVDGFIGPGEWSEATEVTMATGVKFWVGSDARTLYLAVRDVDDAELDNGDGIHLSFDDQGGTPPRLDDGAWFVGCGSGKSDGEGGLLFGPLGVFYTAGGFGSGCTTWDVTNLVGYAAGLASAVVVHEIALPLDGATALEAVAGEQFKVRIGLIRDTNEPACYPDCGIDPANYGPISLASIGCNSDAQTLADWMPLDWKSTLDVEGSGWGRSGVLADPVFCEANVTGGAGPAACTCNDFYEAADATASLYVPFNVSDQPEAELRMLTNFQEGDVDDQFSALVYREDLIALLLVHWTQSHGSPSGPGEAMVVPIPVLDSFFVGNPPRGIRFHHSTFLAGGQEGGFAQIDELELRCGPRLFADGFETRLTTHWSADAH